MNTPAPTRTGLVALVAETEATLARVRIDLLASAASQVRIAQGQVVAVRTLLDNLYAINDGAATLSEDIDPIFGPTTTPEALNLYHLRCAASHLSQVQVTS